MSNNTDNENTVVFSSGNDSPRPDGGTQLFTPPNAQQQAQFQRPAQQQTAQPQYPQNGNTQFFAPPNPQQQAQFQRPAQQQTAQPQYPQNGNTQFFAPPNPQQQYQQQPQYQPQQPQYQPQQPQYQTPPPMPPLQNDVAYDPFSKPPKKSYKGLIAAIIALLAVIIIGATAAIVVLKKRNDENDKKKHSSVSEYSSEDEQELEYRAAASSLFNASKSTLSDWTADSVGVKNALITSESSSDIYDGDGSAEEFRDDVEALYPEIADYDYIIVIQDGKVTGAAVSDSFTSRKIGTRAEGADLDGKTLRDILSSLADSMPAPNDEKLKKTVPNVVGMTQQSAIDKITSEGFYAAVDGVYDDTIPEDIVIKQSVKSDTEADIGTEITITVSLGKEPTTDVEVPNVQNIHYELASEQLEAAGLEVNIVRKESSDVAKDIVISQAVAPNTSVEKGTVVTITVSDGSDEEPSTEHTTSKGKVVTEETELNVRKSPSTSSEILGTLPKDSTVTITGQSEVEGKTWYEIEYDGGLAYVSADYIAVE